MLLSTKLFKTFLRYLRRAKRTVTARTYHNCWSLFPVQRVDPKAEEQALQVPGPQGSAEAPEWEQCPKNWGSQNSRKTGWYSVTRWKRNRCRPVTAGLLETAALLFQSLETWRLQRQHLKKITTAKYNWQTFTGHTVNGRVCCQPSKAENLQPQHARVDHM